MVCEVMFETCPPVEAGICCAVEFIPLVEAVTGKNAFCYVMLSVHVVQEGV